MYKFVSCFTAVLLCISLFTVPVLGASTNPLSTSKFTYNNTWGQVRDTAPYPDGEFVEFTRASDGKRIIFNFTPQRVYAIGSVDINGNIVTSFTPPCWRYHNGTLEILSSEKIYRKDSSSADWREWGTSGSFNGVSVQYLDPDGQLKFYHDSSLTKATFYASISGQTLSNFVATCPPYYYVNNILTVEPMTYTIANCYSAAVVSSGVDTALLDKVNDMYTAVNSILQLSRTTDSNVSSLLSAFNTFSTSVNSLLNSMQRDLSDLDTNTKLYLNQLVMYDIPTIIQWLSDTYTALYDHYYMSEDNFIFIEGQLDDITALLDKLVNNNGESGGKVIDDSKESAKQKAEDETPDPADDIDETKFSIDSLIGAFNWIKAQLETFFDITHIDTMLEVVLFIALAGWVIGKKLNKG